MSLASSGFCAPVHQTGTPNQEVSSPGSQGVGGLVGEFIIGEIEYSYFDKETTAQHILPGADIN
jgi:hypothetical protein